MVLFHVHFKKFRAVMCQVSILLKQHGGLGGSGDSERQERGFPWRHVPVRASRGSGMLAWDLELNVSLYFSISISDHLTALFAVCSTIRLTPFTLVCATCLHKAECNLKLWQTSSRSLELAHLSLISKPVRRKPMSISNSIWM